MKKIVSLVISLIFIFACCISVSAAGESASCSGNTSVTEGQNITLTFSLSGYGDVTSGGVTISHDNEFEIVSGTWLKTGALTDFNIENKQGVVGFTGATNVNGNIFQLVLKAKTASANAKCVKATFTMKKSSISLLETTATKFIQISCVTHSYIHVDERECNVCGKVRPITVNGWNLIEGKWYYYENGAMVSSSWRKDSIGWVYLGSDGAMLTNAWCTDSAGWCYVGADGYAVTNCWKRDSIGWIWLNSQGSMTKSTWIQDGGKWYYLDDNGYRVSNSWRKDSVGWVYLGSDGAMLTNAWCTDSAGWCYVGADGYALTNCWKRDSIGWIWLNSQGSMTKSTWIQEGGNWYYLNAAGYMVTGSQLIGGTWYYFNSSGVWIG